MIKKHIYFDSLAVPTQTDSLITVQTVKVSKDFFVWHLGFANKVVWQNTNHNEILNLPQIALYHSTYLEFYLVRKVLLTQIGGEVRFSTKYNPYEYSPATSVFYPMTDYKRKALEESSNKKNLKAGNYPIINAFVNIKIRGVLMFFKWEHLNDGRWQDYYAPTYCYPITDFHFMFGILWRFGD